MEGRKSPRPCDLSRPDLAELAHRPLETPQPFILLHSYSSGVCEIDAASFAKVTERSELAVAGFSLKLVPFQVFGAVCGFRASSLVPARALFSSDTTGNRQYGCQTC